MGYGARACFAKSMYFATLSLDFVFFLASFPVLTLRERGAMMGSYLGDVCRLQ